MSARYFYKRVFVLTGKPVISNEVSGLILRSKELQFMRKVIALP